jgi:hypothetical protein
MKSPNWKKLLEERKAVCMIVICSYCRKQYGEKAPWEDDSVSHGMCDGCYTHYARQFEGFSFDYFDDGLVQDHCQW